MKALDFKSWLINIKYGETLNIISKKAKLADYFWILGSLTVIYKLNGSSSIEERDRVMSYGNE